MKKHRIPKSVEQGFWYTAIALSGAGFMLLMHRAFEYAELDAIRVLYF